MDSFINIPINSDGVLTDQDVQDSIKTLCYKPFSFTDLFLYSHGWWTTADGAMSQYTRFTAGFTQILCLPPFADRPGTPKSSFGVGVHWPSDIDENGNPALTPAQALSYYSMERRADTVGANAIFATLVVWLTERLAAEVDPSTLRLNLLGHSFGTRVVCSALQRLFTDTSSTTEKLRKYLCKIRINLVLLQGAFESNYLAPKENYGAVLAMPNVRVLVTKSGKDTAVGEYFPIAESANIFCKDPVRTGMGAVGPDAETSRLYGRKDVTIDVGTTTSLESTDRLVVADLTALHSHDKYKSNGWGGSHSDIYQREIYELIADFLFPAKVAMTPVPTPGGLAGMVRDRAGTHEPAPEPRPPVPAGANGLDGPQG